MKLIGKKKKLAKTDIHDSMLHKFTHTLVRLLEAHLEVWLFNKNTIKCRALKERSSVQAYKSSWQQKEQNALFLSLFFEAQMNYFNYKGSFNEKNGVMLLVTYSRVNYYEYKKNGLHTLLWLKTETTVK